MHRHRFRGGIDIGHLVADAYVYSETLPEALRGLQSQVIAVGYNPAYIIRKSAVGVGDKAGTLKHYYLRAFVKPPYPRGGGGSARDAAHYYNLHILTSFGFSSVT